MRVVAGNVAHQPVGSNNTRLNNKRSNHEGRSDRKLNLMPEFPPSTNYHSRLQNDHEAILSVLSNGYLGSGLSSISLREYIRRGKYYRLNECPCSILVKFNCVKDVHVSSLLGSCSHLTTSNGSHVVVKCDLFKEERWLDFILLKQHHHWSDLWMSQQDTHQNQRRQVVHWLQALLYSSLWWLQCLLLF